MKSMEKEQDLQYQKNNTMKNLYITLILSLILLSGLNAQSISEGCASCSTCPEKDFLGLQDFFQECDPEVSYEITPTCEGEEDGIINITNASVNGKSIDISSIDFNWINRNESGQGLTMVKNLPAGPQGLIISFNEGCEYTLNFEVPEVDLTGVDFRLKNVSREGANDGKISLLGAEFNMPVENVRVTWEDLPGQEFDFPNIRDNLPDGIYVAEIFYGEQNCKEVRIFSICTNSFDFDDDYFESFDECEIPDDWFQEEETWFTEYGYDGGCFLLGTQTDAPLIWIPDNIESYSNGTLIFQFMAFPEIPDGPRLKTEYYPPDDYEVELDWNGCPFANICDVEALLPELKEGGYFQFTMTSDLPNPFILIDNFELRGAGGSSGPSCNLDGVFTEFKSNSVQICQGETLYPGGLLNISGGSTPYEFEWDLDGQGSYNDSDEAFPAVDNLPIGTTTISARITDADGDRIIVDLDVNVIASSHIELSIPELQSDPFGIYQICNDATPVAISANIAIDILGDGVSGNMFDPSSLAPGYYVIYTLGTDCTSNDQLFVEVTEFEDNYISQSSFTRCGEILNLNQYLNSTEASISWSGSTFVSEEGIIDLRADLPSSLSLDMTEELHGCSQTQTFSIQFTDSANTGWSPPSDGIYLCESAIDLTELLDQNADLNGQWKGGSYIQDNIFDPSVLEPGLYPVIYAIGSGDCYQQTQKFIRVNACNRSMSIKVFMENEMRAEGLMKNEREVQGTIALDQPFNAAPFNYAGDESLSANLIPINTTDWVLIELLDSNSGDVESRSAKLVRNDGFITELDGATDLSLPIEEDDSFFLRIHHMDHYSITSSNIVLDYQDFTIDNSSVMDDSNLSQPYSGLWAMKYRETSTSIEEVDVNTFENLDVNIYPNPTSDILTAEVSDNKMMQDIRFDFINANGAIAKSHAAQLKSDQHRVQFDCSDLSAGVYMLRIKSNKKIQTRRVVIIND